MSAKQVWKEEIGLGGKEGGRLKLGRRGGVLMTRTSGRDGRIFASANQMRGVTSLGKEILSHLRGFINRNLSEKNLQIEM